MQVSFDIDEREFYVSSISGSLTTNSTICICQHYEKLQGSLEITGGSICEYAFKGCIILQGLLVIKEKAKVSDYAFEGFMGPLGPLDYVFESFYLWQLCFHRLHWTSKKIDIK